MTALLKQIQKHVAGLPLPLQAELLNYVVYLEYKARGHIYPVSLQERRERLAKALAQAAELNPFAGIQDPVAWQREQRQDRLLPDRE